MNLVAYVVKDAVPSYLQGVPIPRSFSGFTELSCKFAYRLSGPMLKYFLGSGYFAVDGNLPSETILP